MATSADFFGKFRPNPGENWKFAKGQTFTKPFEVVLGAAAAKTSGLVVGDQIYLAHGTSPVSGSLRVEKDDHDHAHEHDHAHDHDDHGAEGDGGHVHREFVYTVVGILEPTGGSHDRALFTDMTSSWILHAHDRRLREGKTGETTEADLLDEDRKITGAYLRLITREGSGAPANLPQVFDTLRRDGSLTVAQPRQEIDRLFVIVSNIDKIFLALAAAVLISSAIAIMLALYNSMEQRRRQIAVLRVLGASRWRVFGLIAAESLILGMLGWVVGVGIAVIGAGAAATALQKSVGLVIAPSLPAEVLVGVGLVTLVLAGVAGLIPAAVAYATPVVRNLRPVA
jgi:putative ABC transport system permease protein